MKKLFGFTAFGILMGLFCILVGLFCISGTSYAGTYKNISDSIQLHVEPGEAVESYELLDVEYPEIWQKVSDEPYAPLALQDDVVEASSATTVTYNVDPESSYIKIWNTDTEKVSVFLNSTSNPFPLVLEPSTTANDSDQVTISNNNKVNVIYFVFGESTGGTLKVQVIP